MDIEIANLENWDIGTAGNGCSSSVCDFRVAGIAKLSDIGSVLGYSVSLKYSLESGKIVSRICTGEKCQNYFGVKSGEEF